MILFQQAILTYIYFHQDMLFKQRVQNNIMQNYKISVVEQISKETNAKMDAGLKEYATSHGINVDWTPFALELFDEKNEVIGVLEAFSSYSSIYINELWVDKLHRGQGYGRKLVAELERLFKHKGFDNINTVTCAFQAPDFYKKCGFTAEFVRENRTNPKLTLTSFVKFFEEE